MVIRIGLVGCGLIARIHLNALQKNKAVQVVGLVDPNYESAANLKEHVLQAEKCQIFHNIDSMNESLPYDAAVIMTPHDLHVEAAKKCISAGKHVLLEKPISNTLSGCDELLKVAKSTEKVLMIGENSRYWPEVLHTKKLIESDAIGKVYFGQANYWESLGRDSFHPLDETCLPEWKFDEKRVGGGILMDGALHWIRSLRILLGDIKEVIGFTASPLQTGTGESLFHALLRSSSGTLGVLHGHLMNIPMNKMPFFQIFGSKGEISIHGDFNGGLTLFNDENPSGKAFLSLGGYNGSFEPQMNEFISHVLKGKPLQSFDGGSVWQAYNDISVSMAIYKSTLSEQWEIVVRS